MPYQVQGQAVSLDEEPRIENGQVYVPLREMLEPLGGRVNWDNNAKIATATIGQWVATIRPDSTQVDVSGTPVTLGSPPVIEGSRVWVPADFFRAAFGYNVTSDASSRTVSIVNPSAA